MLLNIYETHVKGGLSIFTFQDSAWYQVGNLSLSQWRYWRFALCDNQSWFVLGLVLRITTLKNKAWPAILGEVAIREDRCFTFECMHSGCARREAPISSDLDLELILKHLSRFPAFFAGLLFLCFGYLLNIKFLLLERSFWLLGTSSYCWWLVAIFLARQAEDFVKKMTINVFWQHFLAVDVWAITTS